MRKKVFSKRHFEKKVWRKKIVEKNEKEMCIKKHLELRKK